MERGSAHINCKQCGESFRMNNYAIHIGNRKFCSRKCADAAKVIAVPTYECLSCGKTAERKKGGSGGYYNRYQKYCSTACQHDSLRTGSIDKHGYRVVNIKGRQYQEHRLVMEKILGRKLHPEETVHHINGVRGDNKPENLELWASRHGKGQRVTDLMKWTISFIKQNSELLEAEGYRLTPLESAESINLFQHYSASDFLQGQLGLAA